MTVLIIGQGPQVVASVVQALQDHAIESVGVTDDVDATARLQAGGATALVIGGGVELGRATPSSVRPRRRITVIQGALGNRDVRSYVRDELVPLLRQP